VFVGNVCDDVCATVCLKLLVVQAAAKTAPWCDYGDVKVADRSYGCVGVMHPRQAKAARRQPGLCCNNTRD
jgi:hypothetical protein